MEDWLYGAVDLLASEYGWGFHEIMFKTYPEDFFLLQRQIKMRKIDDYLMDISIVANPTKNPESAKEFVDNLLSQRRFMRGEEEAAESLDVEAFNKFRDSLQKESKMIKVK